MTNAKENEVVFFFCNLHRNRSQLKMLTITLSTITKKNIQDKLQPDGPLGSYSHLIFCGPFSVNKICYYLYLC